MEPIYLPPGATITPFSRAIAAWLWSGRAATVPGRSVAARGWILIRVNAEILYKRPWVIVERVVAALRERGCPWLTSVGFRHAPRSFALR